MKQSNLSQDNEASISPKEELTNARRTFSTTSVLLVVICMGLLAGSIGYYLGKSADAKVPPIATTVQKVVVSPRESESDDKSIEDNAKNLDQKSQTVSLEELGIFIEFPPEYGSTLNNLVKQPTDSGSQACSEEKIEDIQVCAVSRQFTAGRGGRFTDNHGYLPSPNGFFVLFPFSESEVRSPLARKYYSKSRAEVLKIKGKSEQTEFGYRPVNGTPGDGYIAAIINTEDPDNYDGVTILMKLSDTLSEEDFDKILDSIRLEK